MDVCFTGSPEQSSWAAAADWSSVANVPADLGSIPGRVIPKTLKMLLDTSLPNTQQYKVRIKGKVELILGEE